MNNDNCRRPDVATIMAGLKDFQRRSAEYVFRRFYLDENPAGRFLVADEVGLGKTLVARGIIARTVDFLWDRVPRIDIIYLCANSEIARQNINRLNILEDQEFALSSRITLLPLKVGHLNHNHVNFVSFTPGTSLDLKYSTGTMDERALLYRLLEEEWGFGRRTGPINLLQCSAGKDNWRRYLKSFTGSIDQELKSGFIEAIRSRSDIRERFLGLAERFQYFRKHLPGDDQKDRNMLIGELRGILAQCSISALEPDLIILDEFQKFKHILDGEDQVSTLARQLFNYCDRNNKARVLLLSATPYKMYTMDHEAGEEDHYADFIRTVGFLLDSPAETEEFRKELRNYRNEIYRLGVDGNADNLLNIKQRLEQTLRKVMIRTERITASTTNEDMVCEPNNIPAKLQSSDLVQFVVVDRVSRCLEAGDHVEYWKSAPYLLNFMDDYKIQREFRKRIDAPDGSARLFDTLKQAGVTLLTREMIENYRRIDPANGKLRLLMANTLNTADWKLLWVPPSLPYYRPANVYAGFPGYTKSLVFSSWQVVPKVISMICSYEAERWMVLKPGIKTTYDAARRRSPLLRLNTIDGRPAGMPLMCLFYPCIALSRSIDPLAIAARIAGDGEPPSAEQLTAAVRHTITAILNKIDDVSISEGSIPDKRWYWAALALLDRTFYREEALSLLTEDTASEWLKNIFSRGEDGEDTNFRAHLDEMHRWLVEPETLGMKPDDLVDVLAKVALASPAVAVLRTLMRRNQTKLSGTVLKSAAGAALGFRTLFNIPESMSLIRSINDSEPYWERVLEYCLDGNLQAVIDEYAHVLYESLGLFTKDNESAADKLAETIHAAVSIRTARQDFQEVILDGEKVELKAHGIRCRYAMRFGQQKNDMDDEVTRGDQVLTAFNSPFRPFILATTSIGQEGLDFHQYCHSIYHWNLPSNPVDFEQREGRIHRYKGHAIRRSLAKHYGLPLVSGNSPAPDPWSELFARALAERPPGANDLYPYWVYDIETGYKIIRHVPALPLSRELDQLRNLKRSLALYRMVFGQPNQEDLLTFLQDRLNDTAIENILKLKIDLSPP